MGRKPEQIIGDQVRIWEHFQAMERHGEPAPRFWPAITISREYAARGAALAAVLAERTGFTVWDKELVHAIAEEIGGDERILQTLDEHLRNSIDDIVHAALQHGRHTNLKYLRSLMRIVHTLAAHGNCIIVGRGANFICKPGTVFRVRLVSPLDVRAHRYMEEKQVREREARRAVEQMDAERADFVRRNFRYDVADPVHYDLVLNSGTFALDQIAEQVLSAYEAWHGERPPKVAPPHQTPRPLTTV